MSLKKTSTAGTMYTPNLLYALFLILSGMSALFAHNGALAYAYPVSGIQIDGKLADWPAGLRKYPIRYYENKQAARSAQDTEGYFMVGYDLASQSLYVAVAYPDDAYIRNPENPVWWAHDMQVLYVEPRHSESPSAVLALEVNEYLKKIVGQEETWDAMITGYSWEQVTVKVHQEESGTMYEWKIRLEGFIKPGRVLGFDYVIFDKDDPDKDNHTVAWGTGGGIKHQCSPCLGDLMLLEESTAVQRISGNLQSPPESLPSGLEWQAIGAREFHLTTAVDSAGNYSATVPEGRYLVRAREGLEWKEEQVTRIRGVGRTEVEVRKDQAVVLDPPPHIERESAPDLIPEKGVLFSFDPAQPEAVDGFIEAYMKYYGIPGVSLALIKNGKRVYQKTYGVRNTALGQPVAGTDLFEAASITKPVFAYVVLSLAEKGIVDLDKPLYQYLPFDELEGKFPEYQKMTARHVLIHQTGLPNWGRELLRTPGTEYGYSGEGFEYLKRVVAHITGKQIEDVVKEELIHPLGLTHMEFSKSRYLEEVAVTGHFDGIPAVQSLPAEAGMAWSMYTEAAAFTDFALSLLYRKGLKPETYTEMMRIHSEFPEEDKDGDTHRAGMGLGIALADSEYGPVFGHGGNNGDFRCQFTVFEDLKMGFAVFTNGNTGRFLADDLEDFLIGGKPAE